MDSDARSSIRLNDRILSALELALEQEDLKIAEALETALEIAMTRNIHGAGFVERRDYPPEMEKAIEKLERLREKLS